MKLLTIVVPTYNRREDLLRLAGAIADERQRTPRFDELCDVKIFDNASEWSEGWHPNQQAGLDFVKFKRHEINIGADANVRTCFDSAASRHVWILGDDDLPQRGFIQYLIELLELQQPDLVYAHSKWCLAKNILLEFDQGQALCWNCKTIDARSLSLRAGTSLTFISSIIVNKEKLTRLNTDGNLFSGSQLPQLAWVLPLLIPESRILMISQPAILATTFNSGNYSVIQVFAKNYPAILFSAEKLMNISVAKLLKTNLLLNYLPGLVLQYRTGRLGKFKANEHLPVDGPISQDVRYRILNWADKSLGKSTFHLYVITSKCVYHAYKYVKLLF